MMMYVLAMLASFWTAEPCEAAMCVCMLPVTAQEAWDRSQAVFTGVVVGTRDARRPLPSGAWNRRTHVTFRVEMAWKGVETPEMVIVDEESFCDYQFHEGKRYMVYAIRHSQEGYLIAGVCSRTHQVASYHDDVDIGVLTAPVQFWAMPTPVP